MRLRSPLSLILVAALAVAAGCGGGSATPTATPPPGAAGIPTATPFATVPAAVIVTATAGGGVGSEVTYTVQPGDSLLAIASRFGSTVEAIQSRNNLSSSEILVGQELIVPNATAIGGGASGTATPTASDAPSQATATPSAGGGSTQVYVVQSGDTALGIAFQFNTTLDALAAANGMTVAEVTNLRVGQKLQIPAP
jgi:LysM repeat protein